MIDFAQPIPVDSETQVTVSYSASPALGLYFRVPSNGYDAADINCFTQGEMIEARHWMPCYDYPNAKFTSDVTCRVPDGMTVMSNGRLVSSTKDSVTGLTAVRWVQDKPHVNYLISLVAGKFTKFEDKSNNITLALYCPSTDSKYAPAALELTKPMIPILEKLTGVEYPWDQHGEVLAQGFSLWWHGKYFANDIAQ